MRERLVRDEAGFTLPELLVTMLMMITVLFALYSIFDMSLRVFSFGNNKIEAVENARLGLERMEREIRAAYPVDKASSPSQPHLFFNATGYGSADTPAMPSATQITFGNEVTGDRKIQCPAPPSPLKCEYITYKLSTSGSTRTLLRNNSADGSVSGSGGEPVIEYVDGASGLSFTYLRSNGITLASNQSQIAIVRITLKIKVDRGIAGPTTQTLSTDVALANRGN